MPDSDRTGRAEMSRNVVASWVAYGVFIVFGFILPRAIDDAVGQEALGVWDFAWSIVHYLGLSRVGIGSSVNRYVARYRSRNDNRSLSQTVSTINAMMLTVGTFVAVTSIALSNYVPMLFGNRLGDNAVLAGSLILFLGLALAVQLAFDAYRGVLTGCHRWVAYNVLNATGYAVAASGMLVTLVLGGGLTEIAVVYLAGTILTEMIRAYMARRACPEIEYSLANVNAQDAKKVLKFGLKTVLIGLPRMITIQTVNIFVVANMGAAMLAVFARPLALTNHIMSLVEKFANVLTPTAGYLQGSGQQSELREFTLSAMRVGWLLAAVPTVYLAVLGDKLVHLWMGPEYENLSVVIVLACGSLVATSQFSLLKIMVGLNAHGPIARQCFINAISALIVGSVIVHLTGWSLTAAAFLIATPSVVGTGIVVPYHGCKKLSISPSQYLAFVLKDPVLVILATVPVLVVFRMHGPQNVLNLVVSGLLLHLVTSALVLRNDVRVAFNKVLRPSAV